MIKFENLFFSYPQTTEVVLKSVTFCIKPGTLTLVTGASGSGKSTLLRCINGLVPHFSGGTINGKIDVFGSDPIKEGPEILSAKVGFVFQEPEAQFVFDIVEDEIAFALENLGIPRDEMQNRVNQVIERMHLAELRRKKINNISGGEKQKVAIASALVSMPQVLVLDEPTSQLDPSSADEILQQIVMLKEQLGLTVILSEHRLERLLPYADSMIYLAPKKEVLTGTPQEILPIMQQVPPVTKIAKMFQISPLPLIIEDFPIQEISRNYHLKQATPGETPKQSQTLIDIKNLNTKIGEKRILRNLSLEIHQNEILTLLGENGSGKTTLLRSILGLIDSTGERLLFGEKMHKRSLMEIIQHIAYLPQNPNDLLFADTILDELKITLGNHNLNRGDSKLSQFLEQFNLGDKQHRYPRDLSVGERQRTALASITVHDPQIILLDEPTRGLDYNAKQSLSEIFFRWRNAGKAILLVTHDVEFAALLADRVAILENGSVVFDGDPRIGFRQFPTFTTKTAQIFPQTNWVTPGDVKFEPK